MACGISELYDDLLDNADFEEAGSVTKARAFISAANRWLIVQPAEQQDQHNRIRFNGPHIEKLLARAQAYVAANDTSTSATTRVRFFSLINFR